VSPQQNRDLVDARARQRIREEFGKTLLVEAAAGTGKTTELVRRIVGLLLGGHATLDRIVAVTFTDKAAGEMKLRLRTRLEVEQEGSSPEVHDRITAALARLEVAPIGTMHSFCADLLREWPVEARIDPQFEIAAEGAEESVFAQAFETWFQSVLVAPPEGIRRALRRRGWGRNPETARERLRGAARALAEHRDFPASWRRDAFDRSAAIERIASRLGELAALATKADNPEDWCATSLREIATWLDDLMRRENVRGRDEDGLEAALQALHGRNLWKWSGRGKWFCKKEAIERSSVIEQRDAIRRELGEFAEGAAADLAACLREELRPVVAAYEELKARTGMLDFLDLLLRTRDLLRGNRTVRVELQHRFSHILVDEFQDTDPLQAETVLLLAADDPEQNDPVLARPIPGKLFIVGDPKQSIYRFRRADIAFYQGVKSRLKAQGAEVLQLSTSFRSAPSIQQFINATFAPRMVAGADAAQAGHVPLDRYRNDPEGRPTVVALPAPHIYGKRGDIAKNKIEESYPKAVAAFVEFLIRHSGWTVTERDRGEPVPIEARHGGWTVTERERGKQVPIEARHICLLFKRQQSYGEDITREYLRGLEARRIPHVLVGGRSYFSREETQAMRVAATAIEWPDDELSVFATLRGPFFAVGDDALLLFRERQGRLHPLRKLDEVALSPQESEVADALRVVGELHRGRNQRPISHTLSRLLDATRAHAGIAIWPTGEQALANVLHILEHARRFEGAGGRSFRSFVDLLSEEAGAGNTPEAPVVEEGTDGIRVMTVHKAKGLEFPVVILCDPTAPSAFSNPSRHVETERGLWAIALAGCAPAELVEHRDEELNRDREESVRLAYVAATRARDLLVVPAIGDASLEGWLDVFSPALHPKLARRRQPSEAPGCPRFGKETVLDRPEIAQAPLSVSPGLHESEAGPKVVWWDPATLVLDREPEGGVRDIDLLVDDAASHAAAETTRQMHAVWQQRRTASLHAGTLPSVRITTVTERTATAGASASGTQVETASIADRDPHRPRGKRFGALVHSILAAVDLRADAPAVARIAAAHARLFGADDAEAEAATKVVQGALAHPLLQRAANSADCRRELPFLHREADGAIVEGTVDLAFREQTGAAGRWTVLEFKTGTQNRSELHKGQVRTYCAAVEDATGEPATGAIIFI